jgi:hypothetical protein
MSGEVSLTLGGGAGKRGSAMGAVAGILAANVVGLGAFAAANKLGQGKDQAPPQVNCSPRQCFFLSAAEPCQCNTPNVSGGTCGTGGASRWCSGSAVSPAILESRAPAVSVPLDALEQFAFGGIRTWNRCPRGLGFNAF